MNKQLPARALRAGDSFLQLPELALVRLIVGLGNPGMRFNGTRHNVGFAAIDQVVQGLGLSWREKTDLIVAEWQPSKERKIFFAKPLTFMNNSGRILPHFTKLGLQAPELLVLHDELEKPLGAVSLRYGGSSKGHNGLKSIMSVVGSEFWRLQLGIDRPADKSFVADYVLSKFLPAEKPLIAESLQQVANFFGAVI